MWRAEIAALHAFVPDCTSESRKTIGQAAEEVKEVVDGAVKAESEAKSAKEKKRGVKRKRVSKKNEGGDDSGDEEDGDM